MANTGSLLYPVSFTPVSATKTTFEGSVHGRETFLKLIILKHATEESNSHLGCGFNEEMAHKVAGRILKRSLIFMVLQID
jgi:hypothetical protein